MIRLCAVVAFMVLGFGVACLLPEVLDPVSTLTRGIAAVQIGLLIVIGWAVAYAVRRVK